MVFTKLWLMSCSKPVLRIEKRGFKKDCIRLNCLSSLTVAGLPGLGLFLHFISLNRWTILATVQKVQITWLQRNISAKHHQLNFIWLGQKRKSNDSKHSKWLGNPWHVGQSSQATRTWWCFLQHDVARVDKKKYNA